MRYHYIKYVKQDLFGALSLKGDMSSPTAWIGMAQELADFRAEIAWDDDVRVIILAGQEDHGFELELCCEPTAGDTEFRSVAHEIAEIEKPVIASIEGHALGWGLELVLSSDLRIASDSSRFGFPQITLGSLPWEGGTQRLPRSISRAKALEMILTGESIDAAEACRIGLINKRVPVQEVTPVTLALARDMASKGPLALRYAKEAIHKGMDMTLVQGLRLEADLYCLLQTTLDRTEGIQAYLQKKGPVFKGE